MEPERPVNQIELDRTSRFDVVLAEYLEAVEDGVAPSRKELFSRHPDLADELREFFANRDRIETLFRPAPAADTVRIHIEQPRGRRFGDYELLGEIARGGMGVVYKARQIGLNRTVALKMIRESHVSSAEDKRRFYAEAETAANLQHPNIVAIYEVGETEGQPYFSMDFVEGPSLAELVAENPLPPKRAAAYMHAAAAAMHYAHSHEVLHRDLKPSNILVDTTDRVRITDFGLARRLDHDSSLTCTGQVLGTPSYMSPEQAAGKHEIVGPASDIYSLGVVLYELLTGRPPFRAANPLDTLLQIKHNEPVSPHLLNPKVPRDLETICLKCLQKEPARRYSSAQLFAEDLQRFLTDRPIQARPIHRAARLWRWCRRNRAVAALLSAAAFLMLLVAVVATAAYFREAGLRIEVESKEQATSRALAAEIVAAQQAKAAKDREAQARRTAVLTLTDMNTAMGLMSDERNDPAHAALWFANAARSAPLDERRQRYNRTRVQTWLRRCYIPVAALSHEFAHFRHLAVHPSGRYLYSIGIDDECNIWDLEEERVIYGDDWPTEVCAMTWSADGRWLALGTPSGTVDVFGFPQGKRRAQLGHAGKVKALTFSPDGRYLAVGSNVVRVWDCDANTPVTPELQHPEPVEFLIFNAHADRLATACYDDVVRVFALPADDPNRGELYEVPHVIIDGRHHANGRPFAPLFVDNDRQLITAPVAGDNVSTLTWWDSETGQQRRSVQRASLQSLTLAPSGRRMFAGGYGGGQVYDAISGRALSPLLRHRNSVVGAAFSPNGQTLLTACIDNTAQLWSLTANPRLIYSLPHQAGVQLCTVFPDGKHIATAEEGGLVRVCKLPASDPGDWSQRLTTAGSARSRVGSSGDGIHAFPRGVTHRGGSLRELQVYEVSSGRPIGKPVQPHANIVEATMSPDGRQLAIAVGLPGEAQVQIWDWRIGAAHRSIDMQADVRSLAYGQYNSELAVLCADGTVEIVDSTTGKVVRNGRCSDSLPGTAPNDYINNGSIQYSPDSRSLLVSGLNQFVYILDVETLEQRCAPLEHAAKCHDARFSADGKWLVTASDDRTVQVWNAQSGEKQGPPLVHPDHVFAALFDGSARHVLTACRDGSARLWDWSGEKLVCPPFRHNDEVFDVGFVTPDELVVTGSKDGTLRIWESHTGKPVTPAFGLAGLVIDLDVPAGASHIMAAGFMNQIYAIHTQDLITESEHTNEELCLFAELISGSRVHDGSGVVRLTREEWHERWRRYRDEDPERGYRAESSPAPIGNETKSQSELANASVPSRGKPTAQPQMEKAAKGDAPANEAALTIEVNGGRYFTADISADGSRLASIDRNIVQIWDAATGKELYSLAPELPTEIYDVKFSPSGDLLAMAGRSGITLWDLNTRKQLRVLTPPTVAWATRTAFSPDGRYLVGGHARGATVWKTATWEVVHEISGSGWLSGVAFSKDARRFVVSGQAAFSRVYDLASGEELQAFDSLPRTDTVDISPDGNLLASVHQRFLWLWNEHGEAVRQLEAGRYAAAFSPGGKYLAVSGRDHSIIVLEASTGEEVLRVGGHTAEIHSLVFSREGGRLVSASADQTVRLWRIPRNFQDASIGPSQHELTERGTQ
jgi:WD40 repeat protein/tRNA A-37 threonylcarbamoyl transferase component Bud32